MSLQLSVETRLWPLREPFVISRGAMTETPCIIVTLIDAAGRRGRGEGCGVDYDGETPSSMTGQIERVRSQIESGVTRAALLDLLPDGGARCAVDCALWSLEARQSGRSVFESAGVTAPAPVRTAFSIGIRSIAAYEATAQAHARFDVLKVKVSDVDPLAAVRAVGRGAPGAQLIVDPNQSWSVSTLQALAPRLQDLGVVLLEQPIRVGDEDQLDGYASPVPLCADELVRRAADLARAKGRFGAINIKLDKTGGLTEALRLAEQARAAGFQLMVGCMGGSSLSMAPALVLAQQCAFVDLDGPLLLSEDWPGGLTYDDGVIGLPDPGFWG